MNRIILFLLTAFLLFISCTKEIEIEIPEQEPKLVIYSTIEPLLFPHPKSLRVSLQQSAHISDTASYPVNDALILYYENDSLKDTLKCVDSTGTYPITKGLGDYPVQGNSYAIKVLTRIIHHGFNLKICTRFCRDINFCNGFWFLWIRYSTIMGKMCSVLCVKNRGKPIFSRQDIPIP